MSGAKLETTIAQAKLLWIKYLKQPLTGYQICDYVRWHVTSRTASKKQKKCTNMWNNAVQHQNEARARKKRKLIKKWSLSLQIAFFLQSEKCGSQVGRKWVASGSRVGREWVASGSQVGRKWVAGGSVGLWAGLGQVWAFWISFLFFFCGFHCFWCFFLIFNVFCRKPLKFQSFLRSHNLFDGTAITLAIFSQMSCPRSFQRYCHRLRQSVNK